MTSLPGIARDAHDDNRLASPPFQPCDADAAKRPDKTKKAADHSIDGLCFR
jgi:hypothetical protein